MSHLELSESDYNNILKKRFGEENSLKFVKATFKAFSENVEGFAGEHYKLDITYKDENAEEKTETFFVKTKPFKNQYQREYTENVGIYILEIFLYNHLFREFEECGLDVSFSPKCYFSVANEAIILEDMSAKGYQTIQPGKMFNLEQAKHGLKSLALLHAAGWMYEDIKSKEFGRNYCLEKEFPDVLKERLFTFFTEFRNTKGETFLNSNLEMFCKFVEYLPKSEEYKNEFKRRIMEKELGKIMVKETGIRKTITHGDLWSNNLLFKMVDDKIIHCSLVDYQGARYFYPSYDVLLFLHSNLNAEYRREHLQDLLQYYYKSLSDILAERGYNILEFYPREDYEESLKIVDYEAKIHAYSTQSIVLLPQDLIKERITADDDSITKLFTDEKVSISVEAFLKDETYRKFMTACLYEIRESLF